MEKEIQLHMKNITKSSKNGKTKTIEISSYNKKSKVKNQNNRNTKNIEIQGRHNRYCIKKLTTDKVEENKKELYDLDNWCFLIENQKELLNSENSNIQNALEKSIKSKRQSYYQQDILKKCYDEFKFISLKTIYEKIKSSQSICHYCRENLFLLYKIKLEKKQWTLDRINNSFGHNHDNVVICCLQCNLERKNKSQEKYMFDVNLTITKEK